MQRRRHHKGGALIAALFIATVAAIIAVALVMQQRLMIDQAELMIRADTHYLQLEGMQYSAMAEIERYVSAVINNQKGNAQFYPLKNKLPIVHLNTIEMTGVIENEGGKYNVNDLVYSANQSQFVTLLRAVVPSLTVQQAYDIAKAITTWMTSDTDDRYYMRLHPPYRASKQEMSDISELRLVSGVTPDIYAALKPYITAIPVKKALDIGSPTSAVNPATPAAPSLAPSSPTGTPSSPTAVATTTPIDINATSAPVLLTTSPSLTLEKAQAIIACRQRFGGFNDTATFTTDCVVPVGVTSLSNITTVSHYFLVRVQAVYGHHSIALNRLWVTKLKKNNKLDLVTVWQSFE